MKIKPSQMKAFRSVLSKEDKTYIAQQADMSYRTIEAVLNRDRTNHVIESLIFHRVRMISIALNDAIREVELNNVIQPVTLNDFQTFKTIVGSDDGEVNRLYTETYLQLSHQVYEPEQLLPVLLSYHKNILHHSLYCILLIQKLCGVVDSLAVNFFNENIVNKE